jgi:hypothetical protein
MQQLIDMLNETSIVEQHMPPSVLRSDHGAELSSWRFYMLRYFGLELPGIPEWDSRWDTKEHLRYADCGADRYCFGNHDPFVDASRYETNIMAIVGPDTAFDRADGLALDALPNDLVVLVEVQRSKTHWMEPGDYHLSWLSDLRTEPQLGATVAGAFHVAFADGEVWLLEADIPRETLLRFCTRSGSKNSDRQKLLAPWCRERFTLLSNDPG